MPFEYIKNYYGVEVDIGQRVIYKGDYGTVNKDGGHYISVNFDKYKPCVSCNIHPKDENLEITNEFMELRKITRSQKRYQDYLNSHHYDVVESFSAYLGIN